SLPVANTIGTVVVAALAEIAARLFATITATGRWINSATRPGPILLGRTTGPFGRLYPRRAILHETAQLYVRSGQRQRRVATRRARAATDPGDRIPRRRVGRDVRGPCEEGTCCGWCRVVLSMRDGDFCRAGALAWARLGVRAGALRRPEHRRGLGVVADQA